MRTLASSDFRVEPETGCWVWQHSLNRDGYGQVRVGRRVVPAHRWAYAQLIGPPDGTLEHQCRQRACINPQHLIPVSRGENAVLVHVAAGRLCWYCYGPITPEARCARCGADPRWVTG